MHNYWIAALEHFGLVTREEAEHISKEIRLSIHRENYADAKREMDIILSKFDKVPVLLKLEGDIADLRAKVSELTTPKVTPAVAKTTITK